MRRNCRKFSDHSGIIKI